MPEHSLTRHTGPVSAVYSTYEAKARFSEVLRLVRFGTPVIVTHHGKPVAGCVFSDGFKSLGSNDCRIDRRADGEEANTQTHD